MMELGITDCPAAEYDGAALVLTVSGDECLEGSASGICQLTDEYLADLHDRGEIGTRVGQVTRLFNVPGVKCRTVVLVGTGQQPAPEAGFVAAGAAIRSLADQARKQIGVCWGRASRENVQAAVCGAMNGAVGQGLFRRAPELHAIEQLQWIRPVNDSGTLDAAIQQGREWGQAMLFTRELVNLPANKLQPISFAAKTAEMCTSCGIELEVWDELRLRREGCDALLSVSAASTQPARLLILRYGLNYPGRRLGLVGKGVTFDSGGLSIKSNDGMSIMKCDMAGAATVVGAMQAIASQAIPLPVVGVVGLVENMISGASFKLGDVITTRQGTTVEVHNTDAEGRLVLADALDVALQLKPDYLVDVATLTGACVVALGRDVAGVMSNDDAWQDRVLRAAEEVGEKLWPLPMYALFDEQIKGQVADIRNTGDSRWGGAITAAKFLEQFVAGVPWAHLDIAGPAFAESAKAHLDAGASGSMVRTLIQLAMNLAKEAR